MDAMVFCKQLERICKSHLSCESCPLGDGKCSIRYIGRNGESVVKIVEQWAKEHPVKTRQSEFLKRFPNAMINESDGILCIPPCNIEGKRIVCAGGKNCGDCRREYWLTEVTDNGND